MTWWKWSLWVLLLLVAGVGLVPAVANADVTANITLFATPLFGEGINSFTITYVTDTSLKLDWVYGTNVTGAMIRAKYGTYPADIVAESETPSDGYLVYQGTGTTINDTSMDFDANPGPLYYRIWAYRADGSWIITPGQGWKESMIMTLLGFLAFAGIVSYFGARSSYWILQFLAGTVWWAVGMYWINNRPSTITQGDPEDIAVIGLLFFVGLAFMFMPYWYSKDDTRGRLRLPFMHTDEQEEAEMKARYSLSRSERNAAYEARVKRALRGETRR